MKPYSSFQPRKRCEEENIKFIKISKENFLEELMQKLYENQIQSVLVEGGSKTLQTFIDANLWDETIIIKNENLTLENGTKAPKFEGNLMRKKNLEIIKFCFSKIINATLLYHY
jgi:diaminohydroxyphosphoribosylaminopyrimidine deaminase/5-amino-6-(5-phosphoribosylamino)uracil reductase